MSKIAESIIDDIRKSQKQRGYILRHLLTKDEQLRKDNPALQEAWEQYQVIYNLCDTEILDDEGNPIQ